MPRVRISTLVGGLSVIALGIWILLDSAGTVDIRFDALGAALAAAAGLTLLASGLEDSE
jgi:hypothetical protein